MLREIKINGYRGLKEMKLSDLSRINVLVGENNSGKTSILEAIQLLDNKSVLNNLISIARKREVQSAMGVIGNGFIPFDAFAYSFSMKQGASKEIRVQAECEEYGTCEVRIESDFRKDFLPQEDLTDAELRRYRALCDEEGAVRMAVGHYFFKWKEMREEEFTFRETQLRPETADKEKVRIGIPKRGREVLYISPMDIYTNRVISASLYRGMLVEEKQRLLDLLKLFDERIIGIDTAIRNGRPVTLIEMEDCGLVPIAIFGDGLKKILALASAVVRMRGGIVLIDEFETGIHKRALMQVAKWLMSVTESYRVQIFLTTHSTDAIDALVSAQQEYNNISAYRLEHFQDRYYVKRFQGKDLSMLKFNMGMGIL